MADFPSDFWSGWIIVLTVLSLTALSWLIYSIYFSPTKSDPDHADPVWDETLREGRSAPPLWWFWFILSTLVFTVIYLTLFPGLGSFKGALNWSQDSRIESSYDHYNSEFTDVRQDIARASYKGLQSSEEFMMTASRIFSRNCAGCHGEKADGQAKMFPNLIDVDWQWGGTPEDIDHSIRKGRSAVMAGWKDVIGDRGVEDVAEFVLNLRKGVDSSMPGYKIYMQNCIACHGPEGKGNPVLGAPNLADNTWLYGRSQENVEDTIANGRAGVMPAFEHRLDDTQIRLLVSWLTRDK